MYLSKFSIVIFDSLNNYDIFSLIKYNKIKGD